MNFQEITLYHNDLLMNTMLRLSLFRPAVLLVIILLLGSHIKAQSPSPATGNWGFTYLVEELDLKLDGTFTIAEKEGRFTGVLKFSDLDNASPLLKMNAVEASGNTLSFLITEGAFAPMRANLKLSGNQWKGDMSMNVPWRDNFKGSGIFIAIPIENGTIVDHAEIIRNLDDNTLAQGKKYYDQVCATCHGKDGTSSLPSARSFNKDSFKYGGDPFSMWKTIINGAGQMGAQRWLSAEDAYSVVQYVREKLVKDNNPQAYFKVTPDYLESLPKPTINAEQLEDRIRKQALSGSQEYGQLYFSDHPANYGRALYSQIKNHASSSLTIQLDSITYISYNVQRMASSAAWIGSLDLSKTKYRLYRGEDEPMIKGLMLPGMGGMHWSYKDRYHQLVNLVSDRSPFPSKWLHYHGHYQHGDKTVLSYSIVGRKVLEIPSARKLDSLAVLQHSFAVSPGNSWRKIILGQLTDQENSTIKEGVFSLDNLEASKGLPEEQWSNPENSLILSATGKEAVQSFFAAGVQGDTEGMKWVVDRRHQLALYIPPSDIEIQFRVFRYSGFSNKQLENFANFLSVVRNETIEDPNDFVKGGSPLWNEQITLQGAIDVGTPHYDPIHYGEDDQEAAENKVTIPANYPYVVDRIPLPFENPWDSWIRPSGLDFFPDGRLALSTYLGDVWVAEGLDENLQEVKWQRVATGLFDPFGVKVVNGIIHVTCRDRIVRLHDLNEDGETDFYESFFADTDVSRIPVQAFNYSLETDSKGNFIYSKGGQYTNDDEPGHVIEVTSDGMKQRSLAIGIRAPNGVTIGPDDQIFVSDNQGNWSPANKINLIKEGGFYGYIPSIRAHDTQPGRPEYSMRAPLASPNYPDDILPETFEEPIIWLPQEFDNSPGNGAWTADDWGPLGNQLIHTSFGKGWVYQVLMQEIDGITQAAVSALPFQFSAGVQRARISPIDGNYYIAGITGWDDSFATTYGSLDRIRYTGGEGFFMEGVNVRHDGIEITFNRKLDPETVKQLENYQIEQWNYLWTEQYGSAHWSVKDPEKEGQDTVRVQGVELTDNGKKLLLRIAKEDLQPVDQMRIILSLESEDGQEYQDTMYLTIHKVPEPDKMGTVTIFLIGLLVVVIIGTIAWFFYSGSKRKKSDKGKM